MDADLEDGELSGSDSEMTASAVAQAAAAAAAAPPAFTGQSFQSRPASRAPPAGYRSCPGPAAESSSDQDSSDDDEAETWRRKRQKVTNNPPPVRAFNPGRKVNNIWGSVVQEQCQDAITAELGIFGMEGELDMSSRNVETYNYVLARKMMEKEREERELETRRKDGGEVSMLDEQLDEYMKGRGSGERGDKRKRPMKERLGPKAEMDIKGRYDITEDDPAEKVADEIAHRLREPKIDLIERVVAVVGTKKAIELLGETATLEETGGVFTLDGSRRRTPGGVYLNLLKNTPSVSRSQLRKIFLEENRQEQRSKKAAQKRRRHLVAKKMKQAIGTLNLQEHDDVSRETFASDTNEALEALEEGPEEGEEAAVEEEESPEPKPAGTEENPVVYSAADLEVF